MPTAEAFWSIQENGGPIVATAIHNGHAISDEIARTILVDEDARLREEDPYTGQWTRVGDTRVVVHVSRFEFDLNRPRDKAVYLSPADAWGLRLWKSQPSARIVAGSIERYDAFFSQMSRVLARLQRRFGAFVVFDLHSYNHRRSGPDRPAADPELNPEVNIGTGSVDRERWGSLLDRFLSDLSSFDFSGRQLDVRENVKFRGGHFSRWIHQTFPGSGCALAIEFKKFFMDEWTGEPYAHQLETIGGALESTIPGVLEELRALGMGRDGNDGNDSNDSNDS